MLLRECLGRRTGPLAVGGGRVRGMGSSSGDSGSSMWGEGLEKVEELN